MDRIIEWIKKNKKIVLIIAGIFVLILLIIISLIPKKESGLALIEQPLYFYQNTRVDIPTNLTKDFKTPKKGLTVYKLKKENQNIKIEGIISSLLINTPNKVNYGGVVYEWKNKSGDVVKYDINTQTVNASLENRRKIFNDVAYANNDQLRELFKEFVSKYINQEYKYLDITVENQNGDYLISARRDVGGYPLSVGGPYANHDSILLDNNLDLKKFKFVLFNLEEEKYTLEIVEPTKLNSVVSRNQYPRAFNNLVPENLVLPNQKIFELEGIDNFPTEEIPDPLFYRATDIEIVYLFSNINQQFLTPVYRTGTVGNINYLNKSYEVKGVAFFNAIDPNNVYIPSNIIYAN